MTLQTFEELKILHGVERLEKQVSKLTALVEEILEDMKPTYKPTAQIIVIPAAFDTPRPIPKMVKK